MISMKQLYRMTICFINHCTTFLICNYESRDELSGRDLSDVPYLGINTTVFILQLYIFAYSLYFAVTQFI